jgi:glycosyltransferase involved in cell wall biosynthesis
MKVLQIANKAISPPDGGTLAILSLTKGYLLNGYDVHLLNMLTHKHSNEKSTQILKNKNFKITGVKVNTKLSILNLLINFLFSKTPYIAKRFLSKNFTNELINLIKKDSYDIIQLEGLYCLQYISIIKQYFSGRTIYRPHNLEHQIWERNATDSKSILKKIYFSNLATRLEKLETKLLNTYDYIAPISVNDKEQFIALGNTKPILTIPFGIDLESYSNDTKSTLINSNSICYIGALDWIPNQTGILWFIEKVFPIILEDNPSIKLNIAGRNAPEWLKNKFIFPNIIFHGEVDDAHSFLQKNGLMIVPLFSGSGMRVKIIEGMALKKTIIATSIASEGISCTDKENIIITNENITFAESILQLLKDTSLQKKIGEKAYKFVQNNFDNKKITQDLINFIK